MTSGASPQPGADASPRVNEPYSPQLRTALLLTGTGTAGAYHAGVLRAFHETGVKIDIVGANGVGVVGALFAAVDATQRLWEEHGFWRSPHVSRFYPWRRLLRLTVAAIWAAIGVIVLPVAVVALGLVVYPLDFAAKMLGVGQSGTQGGFVAAYVRLAESAFAPDALPTVLPRLAVIVLGAVGLLALVLAWVGAIRRRVRGGFWWRVVPAPLSSADITAHTWRSIWNLIRGAAPIDQPPASELGRRYIELAGENIGQPRFRELVIVVHDLDARRDLTFALLPESRRFDLSRRARVEMEDRRAEVFDLSGVAREHLADVVCGALAVPLLCEPRAVTLAIDSYWSGESHRICDRPGSFVRVLTELVELGARQIIIVSAVPRASGPHTLTPPRIDGRGRFGQYLQSAEAAAVRDAVRLAGGQGVTVFTIRPSHNPLGPFDFAGGFDDRSDRPQSLVELMSQGYEDAYRQFIEPVVGASGDQVG
jgi:hypothetical protein